MRKLVLVLLTMSIAFGYGWGFIEREYTIQEVLDASTNIMFGKVSTVDKAKQRIIVDVEREIKGKSDFKQIKVNVAVGDVRPGQSTPDMLLQKVKPNQPAIVFYQESGDNSGSLAGLIHTNGIWFQIFGQKSRQWWNFSHIEIYMGRTYDGNTRTLQNIVESMLSGEWPSAGDMIKVLVLTGHGSQIVLGQAAPSDPTLITTYELAALMKIQNVDRWRVFYRATKDVNLPGLENADILWIGFREMYRNGYHLNKSVEDRIKQFVKRGGVVIVSGQDYDDNVSLGTGWTPEPVGGVELNRTPVKSTGRLDSLLRKPKAVDLGKLVTDDAWANLSGKYSVALETANGGHAVLAELKYGDGLYLITALANSDQPSTSANEPLIENLINYAVGWVKR